MAANERRGGRGTARLSGYDYRRVGEYFVTTNTHQWARLFGDVRDGTMSRSRLGDLVEASWRRLPDWYPRLTLDAFVVMPDHVHGILFLRPVPRGEKAHSLPEIMRAFKSSAAISINAMRGTPGARVWHRSYYDRLIRSPQALDAMRRYIAANPARWKG